MEERETYHIFFKHMEPRVILDLVNLFTKNYEIMGHNRLDIRHINLKNTRRQAINGIRGYTHNQLYKVGSI